MRKRTGLRLKYIEDHNAHMSAKKFRSAFVAMAPDVDPTVHRSVIETPIYSLTSVLARNEDEAVTVCREMARTDGVHSFVLCPGFTNRGVGRVAEAVGDGVSVNVARGDGPGSAVVHKVMSEAGFFARR